MTGFVEVADGVFVLRYPVLDVNATLVVGDGAALLVDTLSTAAQAEELRSAVRAITPHPWTLVNTHHHFDHCYGNATLHDGCDIWGHEAAVVELVENGPQRQRDLYESYRSRDPELAEGLRRVAIMPPNRTVHCRQALDVGGRAVELHHCGRGHSSSDLVVHVPGSDALVAGDLLEEGAPPVFGDAYPLEWPDTVAELIQLAGPTATVVPGHGAVVDVTFAKAQHDDLVALAWLIRDGHADGATPEAVAAKAPFGPDVAHVAVTRGYAELSGRA